MFLSMMMMWHFRIEIESRSEIEKEEKKEANKVLKTVIRLLVVRRRDQWCHLFGVWLSFCPARRHHHGYDVWCIDVTSKNLSNFWNIWFLSFFSLRLISTIMCPVFFKRTLRWYLKMCHVRDMLHTGCTGYIMLQNLCIRCTTVDMHTE